MTMPDTEDYIVFDRTGTPHVVVAAQTEIGGNRRELPAKRKSGGGRMKEKEPIGEETNLYLADDKDAFDVAKALLNNGYRVQVGPMYNMTKGVCVKVWVNQKKVVGFD